MTDEELLKKYGLEGKEWQPFQVRSKCILTEDVLPALRKAEDKKKFTSHKHIEKVIDNWCIEYNLSKDSTMMKELKRRLMEEK